MKHHEMKKTHDIKSEIVARKLLNGTNCLESTGVCRFRRHSGWDRRFRTLNSL